MNRHIIFVSGREESCRHETEKWLTEETPFTVSFDGNISLFMRPAGDFRPDTEVKKEIYEKNIEGKYDVKFCIDDRPGIVKLWRSLGLFCLDVGEGIDF